MTSYIRVYWSESQDIYRCTTPEKKFWDCPIRSVELHKFGVPSPPTQFGGRDEYVLRFERNKLELQLYWGRPLPYLCRIDCL